MTTESINRNTLTLDDQRASYLHAGEGSPILLLHGTFWSHVWSPVISKLAESHEEFALDYPGFGRSEGRLEPEEAAAPALAVFYPSRPGRSCFSLHRTGRMAMLHGLRGRCHTSGFVPFPASPLDAGDCQLPYSPNFNPIEEAFSKIKRILRKVESRTREALVEAIGVAISSVTAKDARGFFEHCGYGMLV